MSAYQLDADTIDLMVSAAVEGDYGRDAHSSGFTAAFWGEVAIFTKEARAAVAVVGTGKNGVTLFRFSSGNGDVIGRELVAANTASVAARYPRDTCADKVGGMVSYLPGDYNYKRVTRDRFADVGHVFGSLACYEYNACETHQPTLADVIIGEIRKMTADLVYRAVEYDEDCMYVGWSWNRGTADKQRRMLRENIQRDLEEVGQ